jgi:hypothetical protein
MYDNLWGGWGWGGRVVRPPVGQSPAGSEVGNNMNNLNERKKKDFLRPAKLREATVSFVTSVLLSGWKNSAATGRIFMKFDI